ncbi:MAG: hypothetical protein KF819_34570 [Labilithrix sp.]|nr:hypothetical protein [Labilithrix sp.]
MQPYRVASPPEPEPSEAEHPYVRVLQAQRRRTRIGALGFAIVAVACAAGAARAGAPAPRAPRSEAARVDSARSAIAGARARAARAQARFELGVRDAIGRDLASRPDLGACPLALPAVSSLVKGRAAFPLLTIQRAEIGAALPSQAVAGVLADVRRAEAHLASGRYEEAALYARALDRPERFGYDVVLVAKTSKRPYATSAAGFEPGEVAGRAYLYDFATNRVVCAGEVVATSSKTVGYVFAEHEGAPAALGPAASMGDAIDEDIRLQTERAIVEALRWRAGPAP